ncbi:MAG: ComEC/Rec2 family competence protein [Cyanobacteria bacterium J06641_5]
MLRLFATQLCLAFGVGLVTSWALGLPTAAALNVALAMGFFLVAGGIAALILPQRWLDGPDARGWLALGLVAAVAVAYLQLRLPRPTETDVSQLIAGNSSSEQVRIWGTVQSSPSLTASNKVRFWLRANRTHDGRSVGGKLYVTTSLLQGTGVYPGQTVAIAGWLYQPQTPKNPGAFNFRTYLSRQGTFAGFNAETIEPVGEGPPWGWWQLRRRIVKAFVRGLGSPAGQLVGSIALGRRAVDLPPDVRELFVRGGLAHILAASGFHVSLLLNSVGTLTQEFRPRARLAVSLGSLLLYVGLTGISPSVARAAIMGAAGAIAQQRDRQVNSVGALLLAAAALLAIQPLWIADLGFQLSFLATLGLLATAPTVAGWFACFPKFLAGAIAVPIAVLPWVLPLQLWTFGIFPPYSIAVNILTVLLVIIVSLGGMLAALVALLFPPAGSAAAGLLFHPTQALMGIVTWCDRLPGSSFALGRITWWQLGALYGAIVAVWGLRWLQRRWGLIALASLVIVLAPLAYQRLTSSQVTLLATSGPRLQQWHHIVLPTATK